MWLRVATSQTIPESETLVRRLAGPSTTKAGLAKDQTEINRVIAEASKGSKFYEARTNICMISKASISEMLNKGWINLSVFPFMDIVIIAHICCHDTRKLVKLEAQRDLSQIIVHVDMDAFYASVELLDDPTLDGKPFGVGHGVLTTASYEARKFGVRSGMPSFIAKKLCPDLVVVANNFHRYTEVSRQVMDIFRRYDPNMCAAGCDEGYLNITRYCNEHQLAANDCVQQMRDMVRAETKLTVSAGIAPNKMLAKICSDKNKPNGQFKLEFDSCAIKAFMRNMSIRKLPGVGRVNERLLESIGIKTCGDIYSHRATLSLMDKQFGLNFLLQAYLGIASNVVQPGQREERKSIGAERTFSPIGDQAKILAKLEEVATELEHDMERGDWTGKTLTLKFKLDTYQAFTRAKSFTRWISTKKEDLFMIGKELLMPELPLTLRLIGLRVTKLKDLRADVQSAAGGIKRFFESAQSNSSPRKKRRLNADEEQAGDEGPSLTQDGFEDAMPGYHEHADSDELDAQIGQLDHSPLSSALPGMTTSSEHDGQSQFSLQKQPHARPPHSAPASSQNTAVASSSRVAKPVSTISNPKPQSACHTTSNSFYPGLAATVGAEVPAVGATDTALSGGSVQAQTCPICGKTIDVDNREFNDTLTSVSARKRSGKLKFLLPYSHRREGTSLTHERQLLKERPEGIRGDTDF
ncbi:DNA polymerase kappa [Grifola frondosa]|uniref:DNA polymerase kappa n=1 Tax=Grifola frondosa TaxID=5627 RepID=A0A1C7M258_GRIFR|nr:DNA polymerase kappa [Grifola frondosa]